jgi:Ca2+-binding EF-hand superfamily protein
MRKIIILILFVQLSWLFIYQSAAQDRSSTSAKAGSAGQNLEAGIDSMFKAMDKDGNKQLSYNEFKTAVVNERKQMLVIERLRNEFIQLDKNRNSSLDVAEFNAHPGLKSLSGPKPSLSQFDRNADQKLDFAEYVGFIQQMSRAK